MQEERKEWKFNVTVANETDGVLMLFANLILKESFNKDYEVEHCSCVLVSNPLLPGVSNSFQH